MDYGEGVDLVHGPDVGLCELEVLDVREILSEITGKYLFLGAKKQFPIPHPEKKSFLNYFQFLVFTLDGTISLLMSFTVNT